ncbi:M23 family metallopeptidase [Sphingomonas oligophenolica]|uniref:M23 family metallopeptidase n=1 Tax=Sphingomonas oligophenolica TaxID=301154 RepID=A0A502CNV7_9SPHN|nr:M23 family metallopeptidase [Sphingomonas oligophenolica]TPG14334.1 M23 family metallopeptidase [Sphingomonas oligophenolica]
MKRTGAWPALAAAAPLALALSACIPSVGGHQDYPPPPRSDAGQRPAPEAYERPGLQGPVQALPAPRPAWEARPVAPDAASVTASSYEAVPGDTLRGIAERTSAGVDAIARVNRLAPPYVIRVGQRLTIPGGRYHLVKPGQSGIAIARAYGVEWSRIVAANDLAEPYVLRAGQRILIPGSDTAPPSLAERASAFNLDIDDILTGGEPAPAPNQAPVKAVATAKRVLPPTAVVEAPARISSGGFAWPVDGRIVKRFGPGKSGERNDGIQIAVPVSTPIHATADGVVAYVGDGIAALGGLVIVKHGSGWTSVYGHASKLLVQRGQKVKRGQTIALSGDTGFADQPEVHFELRKGRTPVDPTTELPGT